MGMKKQNIIMNDKILDIISKHTIGVPRAKTLEDLAKLENNTVKELETLFSLHVVVDSSVTISKQEYDALKRDSDDLQKVSFSM